MGHTDKEQRAFQAVEINSEKTLTEASQVYLRNRKVRVVGVG